MGFYIDTNSPKDKALFLVDSHKAKLELGPMFDPTGRTVGICVIDNGPFEAAGIMINEEELEAFSNPNDYRPKVWLSMSREEVVKLCPHVEEELPRLLGKSSK